jgi:hypothetical protein
MRKSTGLYFGERLYAGFEVIGAATSTPAPESPVIYSFILKPRNIAEGQCVTLSWHFGGSNLVKSRIFRSADVILIDMPLSGSFTDCPPGTGIVEYRLIIDSQSAGSAVALQAVNIIPNTQPTPTPQPTEEPPPVIHSFDTDLNEIQVGQCVNLSWEFSGTSLVGSQLTRNGEVIGSDLPPTGTQQDCPPQAGQTEYHLKVDSEFSGSVQQSLFVNVLSPLSSRGPIAATAQRWLAHWGWTPGALLLLLATWRISHF